MSVNCIFDFNKKKILFPEFSWQKQKWQLWKFYDTKWLSILAIDKMGTSFFLCKVSKNWLWHVFSIIWLFDFSRLLCMCVMWTRSIWVLIISDFISFNEYIKNIYKKYHSLFLKVVKKKFCFCYVEEVVMKCSWCEAGTYLFFMNVFVSNWNCNNELFITLIIMTATFHWQWLQFLCKSSNTDVI